MITVPATQPRAAALPIPLTAGTFYRRTAALLVLVALALGSIWLVSRSLRVQLAAQHRAQASVTEAHAKLATLQALRKQYGQATLDAVSASVPGPFDLGIFFAWLEATAQSNGVTTQYNFTTLTEKKEVQVPGQWLVAVNFIGPVTNLAVQLDDLEHGQYALKVETLQFDTTDPELGQLTLQLRLYGNTK